MQHVFIIGSKGIPARYGGYETFVEKLTENRASPDIAYHVACAVDGARRSGLCLCLAPVADGVASTACPVA